MLDSLQCGFQSLYCNPFSTRHSFQLLNVFSIVCIYKWFPLPVLLFPGWRTMWMTKKSFLYWYFQRVSVTKQKDKVTLSTAVWSLYHQRKVWVSAVILALCLMAVWPLSCVTRTDVFYVGLEEAHTAVSLISCFYRNLYQQHICHDV